MSQSKKLKTVNQPGKIIIKLITRDERFEKIEKQLKKLDILDDLMVGQNKMISILECIDKECLPL